MKRRAAHFMCLTAVLLMSGMQVAGAADAPTRVWNFSVLLDDKPIGYHRFTLSEHGPERELTTTARFNVKLLFVTVYRYVHDATEHWQGNCLTSLKAGTTDGGALTEVDARADGDAMAVSATGHARTRYPGCVMSFAYWNPEILHQSRLLNSQTGEYEVIKVEDLGSQSITVRGSPVTATHYRINGPKHPIDLWYSAEREWLALESLIDGGRRLRYHLE